jgi:adenylate cyclase, class 2
VSDYAGAKVCWQLSSSRLVYSAKLIVRGLLNAGRHPITTGAGLYFAVASRRSSREIEIKLPFADLPALLGRLQRLRAVNRGRVFEQNTLYDTPEADLRRAGCLLRLRIETPAGSSLVPPGVPSAVITSKAPPPAPRPRRRTTESRYKERLERELAIAHPNRWPHILKTLGFRPAFRYEKYRTSLRLGRLHVDLDETPVGGFLELEGAPRAIDRTARAIGYAPRHYLRATYWDLYAADCKRRRRAVGNMVFDT